ncbi:hypothetical protein [Archangium gephyra]|uniref:hypothetical protein n=1 Tax=Archangium gephyra TaxID=48 RepID=UPI0011C19EB9|nr:hypothetical protein [Archangium gephyra]
MDSAPPTPEQRREQRQPLHRVRPEEVRGPHVARCGAPPHSRQSRATVPFAEGVRTTLHEPVSGRNPGALLAVRRGHEVAEPLLTTDTAMYRRG